MACAAPAIARAGDGGGAWTFVSQPKLHPPSVRITTREAGVSPGYAFTAPFPGPAKGKFLGHPGPVIYDNSGDPVWAHPLPRNVVATDFRPQVYEGRPVLTWWQGQIQSQGYGHGVDVIVDSSYRTIAKIRGANGYKPDLHEFQITPRGTALISAYKVIPANLRRYHGPQKGRMLNSVVQEIDIASGRLLFQWDPRDHLSKRESYTTPTAPLPWDPFHVNSVEADDRGDLLVSMRNTWALYRIRRSDGSLLWRLGGKRSSFRLGSGVRFAWQHDARLGVGGLISVFDNESLPAVGSQSRGLVIHLDGKAGIATLVRQFVHPPGLLAGSQGNVRQLPNGNVFTGWGAAPYFSEFDGAGRLLFDAHWHGVDESYRAYRASWTGTPPASAIGVAARADGSGTTVYASWNGATDVASWQVLAGPDAGSLVPVATAPRAGFETGIGVQSAGPVFVVKALDAAGRTIGISRFAQRG